MKNYTTIIFLLFCYIGQAKQLSKTYTITFNRDDFTISHTINGCFIESDKYDLRLEEDTLLPAIPHIYTDILIADEEILETFTYKIESSQSDSSIILCTNPQYYLTSEIPSSIPRKNNYYPIKTYPFFVELSNINIIDGYSIARFKITPISYDATNQIVEWASKVSITITTSPVSSTPTPLHKHRGRMKNFLLRALHNPEDLTFSSQMKRSLDSEENNIDYVIITSKPLVNTFKPLAKWKTIKGVKTKIVDIEDIYTNYEGTTNQLKIKHFLYDYFLNKGLEYVLLGGDDNIIPVQGCYSNCGDVTDYTIPCDLFYSCFQGNFNWNADNDSLIGELTDSVVFSPDIHCSRIPIQDSLTCSIFVNRIINYEQAQQDYGHYLNLLLAGVKTFLYDDEGKSDTEIKTNYIYDTYIKDYWSNGIVTKFYDTYTDFPEEENYNVNATNLQEQLASNYHLVYIDSHGLQYCWSLENGSYYFVPQAQSLQNNSPMIIVTSACKTNAFDANSNETYKKDPCLSEAFIRNPNSNIIAYLGSSRSAWGYQTTSTSALGAALNLNAYFFNELFSDSITNFAKLVSNAKIRLGHLGSYNKWTQYSVNPLGDPEMPIYTAIPQTFPNVTYAWDGNAVQVNAGTSNTQITLSSNHDENNQYFQTFKTTQTASFTNLISGEYTLCITKHNYKPFIAKVYIGTDFIQNEIITNNRLYISNNIVIGNNVTTQKDFGDVKIQQGSSVQINTTGSGTITLNGGFNCEKGAILEIK